MNGGFVGDGTQSATDSRWVVYGSSGGARWNLTWAYDPPRATCRSVCAAASPKLGHSARRRARRVPVCASRSHKASRVRFFWRCRPTSSLNRSRVLQSATLQKEQGRADGVVPGANRCRCLKCSSAPKMRSPCRGSAHAFLFSRPPAADRVYPRGLLWMCAVEAEIVERQPRGLRRRRMPATSATSCQAATLLMGFDFKPLAGTSPRELVGQGRSDTKA